MNKDIKKNKLKIFMERILIYTFAECSNDYKRIVLLLNKDLKKFKIDFKYTYDAFCIEYLNQFLDNFDNTDIFDYAKQDQFDENYRKFHLYNIQCMIDKMLDKVGLDREIFYKKSSLFSALS
jgi:hypothetical protein